jgi:hypothetical protein
VALSLGRSIFTLALAAGLAFGTAAPATAQSLAHVDQRGDLQSFEGESEQPTPAPAMRNGDIVRTAFNHRVHRITVRAKFADLRRAGAFRGDGIRIVTDEGVRREVSLVAYAGAWRGESVMTRPNGKPVDCAITHKIDYDTNVITVGFPRSCVSDPRWVRLGLGSFWADAGGRVFVDDAQIDGRINQETVRLSPRLRRG